MNNSTLISTTAAAAAAANAGRPAYLSDPEFIVANEMRSVYIWVLLAVGLPTNAACLVTVLFMHVTTATFYVAVLALADSLALVVKLVYHQLTITNESLCLSQHVNHFCSCFANWVLVLITFQRFFAVCFPLKIKSTFTKVKIYISIAVLAVGLFLVIVVPSLFFREWRYFKGKGMICSSLEEMDKFTTFVSIIYFIIPFVLISVFTVLTIVGLQRHRRARLEIQSGSGSAGSSNAERDISIMLVCAGVVFLVLSMPSCVYFLHNPARSIRTYLIFQVVTVLADSNHAVNFFVYFISASRFRTRFIGLLWRLANFVTRGRCQHRHEISGDGTNGEATTELTTERTHAPSLNQD